jgi:hypothetical protein
MILGDLEMKRKTKEKYLGDCLDERGLAASVEETILERVGRVRGAILELTTLCQDFRMEVVGGVRGAIDLWNICIIPSLLNNCGTWTEITEKSVKLCEDQQNMFVRSMMRMPGSTPIPALRALTGLMGMRHRIYQEKLLLILAIQESEDTLARRILEEQVAMGWPGLAMEATTICNEIGLPDINKVKLDKKEIREAIHGHHDQMMREEMKPLKKLQRLAGEDLKKPQDFMSYTLDQARMAMRLKTGMLDIAGDMPGRYLGREGCKACTPAAQGEEGPEQLETRDHLEACVGYSHLWGDHYSEKEVVLFFMRVMKERAERSRTKGTE